MYITTVRRTKGVNFSTVLRLIVMLYDFCFISNKNRYTGTDLNNTIKYYSSCLKPYTVRM